MGPGAHIALRHSLRQVHADAHVIGRYRGLRADELPVQLGGVLPALGGADRRVVHAEGRARVGDREVELDAHAGRSVLDVIGAGGPATPAPAESLSW